MPEDRQIAHLPPDDPVVPVVPVVYDAPIPPSEIPPSLSETDAVQRVASHIETNTALLQRTIHAWISHTQLIERSQIGQEVEEVFGQLVYEALKSANRFDAERQPRAWLLGIAANLVARWKQETIQRNNRQASIGEVVAKASLYEREGLSDMEVFDRVCAAHEQYSADPQQQVIANAWVEERLKSLSKQDREIIHLAVLEGVNMDVVAQRMHIRPGAARVRLHRALERLRKTQTDNDSQQEETVQERERKQHG